jgi:N-acyl-phosphatidylethanolamine-hydrolysing phospholipase D
MSARSRSLTRPAVAVVCLVAVVLLLAAGLRPGPAAAPGHGPHHRPGGGFRNLEPTYAYSIIGLRGLPRFVRERVSPGPSGPRLALVANDGTEMRANGTVPTVTWVGHATLLVQLDGVNILTDPHWGERASPLRFAGPRRLVPAGIRFEDLPDIDVVLISHDHYDHLDEPTVRRLAREHRPRFFVPLGIGAWLGQRGIDDVVELDWWQSASFAGLEIHCTPAQHSSGRTLADQNLRLWSSWVVRGRERRLYFAGDTGYSPGLGEIGRRLGPFDLALIPIGGYKDHPQHHPNHVNPEEAVQLFEDVGGRLMVPMHWGTFVLNREPAHEPPARLMAEALRRGIDERMAVLSPGQTIHW